MPVDVSSREFERCYRAVSSRDVRFDGRFCTAVTTTGIYCRPSCPAQTPKRENVRFYRHPAAAAAAGFRACRRCRPDTAPGSREWDARGDLAARALRLIAEGAIDARGVAGLATELAVSERHLHRILVEEVGVGPLALARTRRAQTARLLIDNTALPLTEVCFAAGFASVRQFNDTMRAEFGCPPSDLRRRGAHRVDGVAGGLVLRLPYRAPLDTAPLLQWFAARAIPGVEEVSESAYRRVLLTNGKPAVITLRPEARHVLLHCRIDDVRDLAALVQRSRRMLDLDADPAAVHAVLAADATLRPMVDRHPGLRVPAGVDGFETAARAILGQQVSLAAARTLAGRLAAELGPRLDGPERTLTHAFPPPHVVAAADLHALGVPRSRARSLAAVAQAVATGRLVLNPGADRDETRQRLREIPGVGPWTVEYVAMRALGDPDAFPATDLALRRAMTRHNIADSERWRPWRAYAAQHLWTHEGENRP